MDDELVAGDIADVYTHDFKFVGRGYINPVSRIPVRLLTRNKAEEINAAFFHRRNPGSMGVPQKNWIYRQLQVDLW